MRFYVYLIISKNLKKYTSYVGYTKNVKKRVYLHNKSKGAKFTRGQFWILAYSKSYKNKSIAMKEEYKLKKNIKLRNKIKKDFINK
tara:strand:- start:1249 stop:1506 length:258 start_codon:yes stop_codon:yes gene_type:complete